MRCALVGYGESYALNQNPDMEDRFSFQTIDSLYVFSAYKRYLGRLLFPFLKSNTTTRPERTLISTLSQTEPVLPYSRYLKATFSYQQSILSSKRSANHFYPRCASYGSCGILAVARAKP